jgi:hypothetical protein
MKQDSKRYADNCCRAKARNTQKQGLFKPLPIPQHKWEDISMDYIEDLPPCKRHGSTYKHNLVIVDRLTKACIIEPMRTKGMEELTEVMYRRVFSVKGLPRTIVSGRGTAFAVSRFWRRYCERYSVKIKLSTAHHAETDGQTEIANKLLNFLRSFVNYAQDDWVDWVPDAEFTANNHANESTGMTPFLLSMALPYRGRTPSIKNSNPLVEAADKLVQRGGLAVTGGDSLGPRRARTTSQPSEDSSPRIPNRRHGIRGCRHFAAERPSVSLNFKYAGPCPGQ